VHARELPLGAEDERQEHAGARLPALPACLDRRESEARDAAERLAHAAPHSPTSCCSSCWAA
jgi:hypothetical protein